MTTIVTDVPAGAGMEISATLFTRGKRKAEESLATGLTDQEPLETAKKIKRLKPEKGESIAPSATRPRSYIQFPTADCVLEADAQGTIEALQNILETEGLLQHMRVEFVHGPISKVRFQHGRAELAAISHKYSKIAPFFCNAKDYCFFKEEFEDQRPSLMGLSESPTSKRTLVRSLVDAADRHFAFAPARSPVEFTFEAGATDREHLEAAYRRFQGLCIGECHLDGNPKKFLIDNMEILRDLGVKTLFMEDYLYDTQQPLLDHYFETPDAKPPLLVKTFQDGWSEAYGFKAPYTYVDILRKAKSLGIRIVGIDTSAANEMGIGSSGKPNPMARLRAMNYVAQQIIDREKGEGKYLAFMGGLHAGTITQYDKDEPSRVAFTSTGMADLLQCPLIMVEDSRDGSEKPTLVNIARKDGGDPAWHEKHIHLLLVRPKGGIQEENL